MERSLNLCSCFANTRQAANCQYFFVLDILYRFPSQAKVEILIRKQVNEGSASSKRLLDVISPKLTLLTNKTMGGGSQIPASTEGSNLAMKEGQSCDV